MRSLVILSWLAWACATACVPLSQQPGYGDNQKGYFDDKQLRLADATYEPGIRTPLLFPMRQGLGDELRFPIIARTGTDELLLEFDEIGNEYHNYFLKIIHCDANWQKSILSDIEILEAFNQYPITNYAISLNTKVPFIHYKMVIPRPKVSGNYVAVVYRELNERDIVLTRRFMVFDPLVDIRMDVKFSASNRYRYENQQVDFVVDHGKMSLVDPMQQVKVVVRQNNRWDNAITDLRPLFFDPTQRLLDYNFFDLENNFKGGNEYRTFDIRTLISQRENVRQIQRYPDKPADVFLLTDLPRNTDVYTEFIDINGRFVIENYELRILLGEADGGGPSTAATPRRLSSTEADYVNVHFRLESPRAEGEVYVFGMLSDWQLKDEFRLPYDPELKAYRGAIPLKQGFYNYAFALRTPGTAVVNEQAFEGSFHVTENLYDILVYYRAPGGRYDQLIGYAITNFFGR